MRLLPLLALSLLPAGFGCSESTSSPSLSTEPVNLDWPAIEQELAKLEGPYLLNFWATWCAPCVAELPELVEVVREYEDQGLQLVTINYDLMVPGVDAPGILQVVRDFQTQRDLPYPVLIYDADDFEAIDTALRLPGPIPVTLAFDRAGNEVGRLEAAAGSAEFRQLAQAALGTSKSTSD